MKLALRSNARFQDQLAELGSLFPTPTDRPGIVSINRFTPPTRSRISTVVGAPYIDGREFDMENAEHVWLPLGSGDSLATTVTKDYDLKPTRNFLPTYFMFESAEIAEALVLYNFQIGGKNALVGSGQVGCGGFSPLSEPKLFKTYVSNTGKPITFTLKNKSGSTVVVYGYIGGLAEPE
jgi:hypothetical protein